MAKSRTDRYGIRFVGLGFHYIATAVDPAKLAEVAHDNANGSLIVSMTKQHDTREGWVRITEDTVSWEGGEMPEWASIAITTINRLRGPGDD